MTKSTDIVIHDGDEDSDDQSHRDFEAEIAAKQAEIAEATRAAHESVLAVQEEQSSMALALTSEAEVTAVKRRMVDIQKRAKEARLVLKERSRELERIQKEQLYEIERVMNETLVPLQKMVERMQDGIYSVNLYLGTREDIVQIMEGKPAPADTPVHVRQRVLAMDEEMMVGATQGGTVAVAGDVDIFDEWVQQPGNLDQVLPEKKGIVAFVSRWRKQFGDDESWHWTYFLIRNGDNVYRIMVQEFGAGKHLIPPVDAFISMFSRTDREGHKVEIEPGTEAWQDAEERADKTQRHYMKIALVLQGLVDRTAVLRPLPEEGLSFIHERDYLSGRVVAITDAELLLEEGRETFVEWQARLLSEMRPGMRVIGAFDSLAWQEAKKAHEREGSYEEPRVTPLKASDPESATPYVIESLTNDGGLTFKFKRTDMIERKVVRHRKGDIHPDTYDKKNNPEGKSWVYSYTSYDYVKEEPKTRGTCLIYPGDDFIIPFDLATIEEMERFLDNREDRQHYITMLPLIKAAIAAKRAEQEEEAPMRQLLVGQLMSQNGLDLEDAEAQVDDLITWYKYTNRVHRALSDDETKTVTMVLEEAARRAKAKLADSKYVDLILETHRDALVIARKRNGRYVVLTPQDERRTFVTMREFGPRSGFTEPEEWKLVNPVHMAKWDIAYTSPAWARWNRRASIRTHLSEPEVQELAQEARKATEAKGRKVFAVAYEEKGGHYPKRKFRVYFIEGEFSFDEDNPLTSKKTTEEVRCESYEWKRKYSKAVLGPGQTTSRTSTNRHWGGSYGAKTPYLWESYEDTREVWVDWSIFSAHLGRETQHRERVKIVSTAAARRDHAVGGVEKQWRAREWAKLKAKFIEEYLDEDLWEDHKNSVKFPRYPLDKHRSSFDPPSPLYQYVTRFIEEGVEFDGLSVAEAQELFRSKGWELKKGHFDKTEGIEEEAVMDLILHDKPAPEDDDEDSDDWHGEDDSDWAGEEE